MKNIIQKNLAKVLMLVIALFVALPSTNINAQQYCTASFTTGTIYWYGFYAYIARVAMETNSSATTAPVTEYARNATRPDAFDNWYPATAYPGPTAPGTGNTNYSHTRNPAINMKIGSTYRFRIDVMAYYQSYTRLFIDLNGDGDFLDNVFGQAEFRGTITNTHTTAYDYNIWWPFTDHRTAFFPNINMPCQLSGITGSRVRVMTSYAVNNGADACSNGYNYQAQWGYNLWYGEVEDYDMNIVPDAPASFPTDENVLFAKENYDGTTRLKNSNNVTFTKPVLTFQGGAPVGTTMQISFLGPLPSTQVVWQAVDANNNTTITVTTAIPALGTYTPNRSTGILDGNGDPFSPGNNGTVNFRDGGEYQIVITIGGAGCPGAVKRNFTAALDYDLSARLIASPRTNVAPSFTKYQINSDIKITGQYINVGLNSVSKFKAKARIYRPDGVLATEIIRDYDANVPPFTVINPGQTVEIEFGVFRSNAIGVYDIVLDLEWAADQGSFNNLFPRSTSPKYTFEIQYDIQVAANQIFAPAQGQKLIANRPSVPRAEYINRGISTVSNVTVTMQVVKISTGEVVYQQPRILEDLSSGRYNTNTMSFGNMVIAEPGSYRACTWITDPNDPIRSDDTTCVTFEVESGIQGTFTVGSLKETAAGYKVDRNFATVGEMMDAIYYDGLSGSTIVEFTDANYVITAPDDNSPAWDFSSNIIGLGLNDITKQIQTLTLKPANNRSTQKGGVNIRLQAASGIGVRFGQNLTPTNSNSIVNSFPGKINSNSKGYITFDGGNQKSFKFELEVLAKAASSNSQTFGAAIYLQRGSENITIKNSLIETVTPAISNRVYLPNVVTSAVDTRFDGETNIVNTVWQGYSAGIVNRNSLLPLEQQAQLGLDTINNRNNVFEGNEISKFGYGIVSLGTGPLFESDAAVYRRYYNNNNMYINNIIYDVARAGIVLGFEEKSTVKGNRIHTVKGTGTTNTDAYGIQVGGNGNGNNKGYNGIDLVIDGNEISNVTSATNATGISVIQVRGTYGTGNSIVSFPNKAENVGIMNNIVWGISTSSASGIETGIHLFTERGASILAPRDVTYFTRNDKIVNNTVIMEANATQTGANGILVGIGVQSSMNTEVRNNAIAILDQNVNTATALTATAVLYQGTRPGTVNSTMFDRNVYYTGVANPLASNVSLFRHVETNATQSILGTGAFNEYLTLEQWQAAYKQDANSVVGNFTNDMVKSGVAPFMYTIKSNPFPLGSILNNRGDRISYVTTDAANTSRGVAGQRYDIGAIEFAGRTNLSDVEMLSITEPRSYQSSTGTFADAQYIMTSVPVNVKGMIRNNGTLLQTQLITTVKIYRQNNDGITFPSTPILTKTTTATIASSESVSVDFLLADGDSDDFKPQSYFDLVGQSYVAPALFTAMRANVTPIYRIELSVDSDQQNANNVITKDVRFYITKTTREIMISGNNLTTNVANPANSNDLMAKLNYNNVINGMTAVNYRLTLATPTTSRFDYDVFDRLAWERRAVNYSAYAFLFYADGNASVMPRTVTEDLEKYMALGNSTKKRNIMFASQELAQDMNTNFPLFARNVLRTSYTNNNPNGNGSSFIGGKMVGDKMAKDFTFDITSPIDPITQVAYVGDLESFPAVVGVVNSYVDMLGRTIQLPGLASVGTRYLIGTQTNLVSGIVSTTLENNVIYLGADWRHISDINTLMRGVISYFESNGAFVIPVELANFTATSTGKKVNINWETSSEIGTSLFEVEKASVSNSGTSVFGKIAELPAAGFSNEAKFYGPVVDENVTLGKTYAYRLKAIDKDGSSEYSEERIVNLSTEFGTIELGNPSPNPAVNSTSVEYSLSQNNLVQISLFDINGNAVYTTDFTQNAGTFNFDFNLNNIASGSYTVVFRVGDVTLTKNINVVK